MERFPDCPRCGERMQEGVRSGDTLMKIWECRQCGETQAREDFITWSETDCLLAIANEQKNIRVQLIRIADALEAMVQADHLSALHYQKAGCNNAERQTAPFDPLLHQTCQTGQDHNGHS